MPHLVEHLTAHRTYTYVRICIPSHLSAVLYTVDTVAVLAPAAAVSVLSPPVLSAQPWPHVYNRQAPSPVMHHARIDQLGTVRGRIGGWRAPSDMYMRHMHVHIVYTSHHTHMRHVCVHVTSRQYTSKHGLDCKHEAAHVPQHCVHIHRSSAHTDVVDRRNRRPMTATNKRVRDMRDHAHLIHAVRCHIRSCHACPVHPVSKLTSMALASNRACFTCSRSASIS